MIEDRLRKWAFITLAILFAAQLYFVQELFAALLLFGALFLFFAVLAVLVYLMQEGGQRSVAWVESHWHAMLTGSRRVLAFAEALSKKTSHHPHSRPAP